LINAGVALDTGSNQLVEDDTGEDVPQASKPQGRFLPRMDVEAAETLGKLHKLHNS
jgi:hypothetical protein